MSGTLSEHFRDIFTRHLHNDDKRKFSAATPKGLKSFFDRTWTTTTIKEDEEELMKKGCVNGRLIANDQLKWKEYALKVHLSQGRPILDGGVQKGKRRDAPGYISKPQGGKREKNTRLQGGSYLHPDAVSANKEVIKLIKENVGTTTVAATTASEEDENDDGVGDGLFFDEEEEDEDEQNLTENFIDTIL